MKSEKEEKAKECRLEVEQTILSHGVSNWERWERNRVGQSNRGERQREAGRERESSI